MSANETIAWTPSGSGIATENRADEKPPFPPLELEVPPTPASAPLDSFRKYLSLSGCLGHARRYTQYLLTRFRMKTENPATRGQEDGCLQGASCNEFSEENKGAGVESYQGRQPPD